MPIWKPNYELDDASETKCIYFKEGEGMRKKPRFLVGMPTQFIFVELDFQVQWFQMKLYVNVSRDHESWS